MTDYEATQGERAQTRAEALWLTIGRAKHALETAEKRLFPLVSAASDEEETSSAFDEPGAADAVLAGVEFDLRHGDAFKKLLRAIGDDE